MQNHHEADPKQQCDRDANDATKSFDAESYDFDTVWPGPKQDVQHLFFFFLKKRQAAWKENSKSAVGIKKKKKKEKKTGGFNVEPQFWLSSWASISANKASICAVQSSTQLSHSSA